MCDQIDVQSMNGGQIQFYNPCEQYENPEACSEDPCFASQSQSYNQRPSCEPNEKYSVQCEDYSQNQNQQCYKQCQPCYQPETCQSSPQVCYQPPNCPPEEMCFRPQECMPCYEATSCVPAQCDLSFQRCNPCEPLGSCQDSQPYSSCPPLETCSPMCSPYRLRRYVQPPRRESCKPIIRYQRPSVPMTSDTIYKQSFDCIDAQTMASCRMPPFYPVGQLKSSCGQFSNQTITKMSFQRHCCPKRAKPIYPMSPSLLGQGPMQGMTTQKHDFVPKFQFKQSKSVPQDNIHRGCGGIEKETIQRLSFMRPDMCKFTRAESCKPIIKYKSPELPMEFETTQNLSFMPISCPAPKDDMPWARKAQYCRPTIKFAKDTVAGLSFQPPGCFVDSNYCCEVKCNDPPRASC